MAVVKPFAALRPKPDLAARVAELPYDVLSSSEARALAAGNPESFLHVSKPEIDLPPGTDLYAPAVYEKARENFAALVAQGVLRQDAAPCFYLYRQVMGTHRQTGVVAAASCREYLEGQIKKHELTRPDKEDDRLRHIETLNAQTGPAFLVHRANRELGELLEAGTAAPPEIDFVAHDGVRHSAWVVNRPDDIARIEQAFATLPALYIADGHHRSAAAVRLFQKRQGSGGSASFLAVIFPDDQVQILPYNRALKDLNGLSPAALLERLEAVFVIQAEGQSQPGAPHQLCFYLKQRWRTLVFRPQFAAAESAIAGLDVSLLQTHVIDPIFGISNARTSERIQFVGGIRGPAELEKLVDSGECACAFSMFPTRIDELMAVADAGGIMPPKSTWFEPKLRDGLFSHLL